MEAITIEIKPTFGEKTEEEIINLIREMIKDETFKLIKETIQKELSNLPKQQTYIINNTFTSPTLLENPRYSHPSITCGNNI